MDREPVLKRRKVSGTSRAASTAAAASSDFQFLQKKFFKKPFLQIKSQVDNTQVKTGAGTALMGAGGGLLPGLHQHRAGSRPLVCRMTARLQHRNLKGLDFIQHSPSGQEWRFRPLW